MSKVSIIIPFYNVEKYLDECLKSIVNQTLKDIEIILINDASDDSSVNIAAKYAAIDERIQILNNREKQGQGCSRNRGIEIATGEYIGFCDSDDIASPDMFEKLYNKAVSENADITMCAAELYDDKTGEYYKTDYYSLKPLEQYFDKIFSPADVKDQILDINVVLWNKVYKREFLTGTGVKFVPGYIYEDLPFFFETFLKAQRINIIPEHLYTYRQNRVFSTMQNSDKKVYDRIPMVERTYNEMKKAPFFEEKKIDILCWIIDDIFHRYTVLEDKYYEDYYKDMKRFFESFALNEEEMQKLAVSYCYDEYRNIIKSSYSGFQRFLIEKYKTFNKRIKAAEHECNLEVKAVKDYMEEFKTRVESEKETAIKWWENHYAEEKEKNDREKNEITANLKQEAQKQLQNQFDCLSAQKEAEIREIREKLNYRYNVEKTKEIKALKNELEEKYQNKIKETETHFKSALYNQKEYYENRYLAVKIVWKLCKNISQIKNKFKTVLKKN